MFELFVMSLREYWSESEEGGRDVQTSIEELQSVLSEHYGKDVAWDEPEIDASRKDDEIAVDVIDDVQLASLHAVAAKLEVDGKLDGLEFDPELPWECDIFDRLEDKLEKEDCDVEKFPHLLSIGDSRECVCVPIDLPFVAQINVSDDEDEDHCDDEDGCCCCCGDDENSIDVASSLAMRRELDAIAEALDIDTKLDIDTDDIDIDDDSPLHGARICWYILSTKLNEAIKSGQPLIIRYSDDEYDDIDEDDDVE